MYDFNFNTHSSYKLGSLQSKRLDTFFLINLCKIFVETGTYKGDGVQWALDNNFSRVYSVEIHSGLFRESSNRFDNNERVRISNADTVNFLQTVIPHIKQPCLIYLDAHISGADSSFHPDHPVPLQKESKIILDNFYNLSDLIVVIDDARLWDINLIENLKSMFKQKEMVVTFVDDSIVFCNKRFLKPHNNL